MYDKLTWNQFVACLRNVYAITKSIVGKLISSSLLMIVIISFGYAYAESLMAVSESLDIA